MLYYFLFLICFSCSAQSLTDDDVKSVFLAHKSEIYDSTSISGGVEYDYYRMIAWVTSKPEYCGLLQEMLKRPIGFGNGQWGETVATQEATALYKNAAHAVFLSTNTPLPSLDNGYAVKVVKWASELYYEAQAIRYMEPQIWRLIQERRSPQNVWEYIKSSPEDYAAFHNHVLAIQHGYAELDPRELMNALGSDVDYEVFTTCYKDMLSSSAGWQGFVEFYEQAKLIRQAMVMSSWNASYLDDVLGIFQNRYQKGFSSLDQLYRHHAMTQFMLGREGDAKKEGEKCALKVLKRGIYHQRQGQASGGLSSFLGRKDIKDISPDTLKKLYQVKIAEDPIFWQLNGGERVIEDMQYVPDANAVVQKAFITKKELDTLQWCDNIFGLAKTDDELAGLKHLIVVASSTHDANLCRTIVKNLIGAGGHCGTGLKGTLNMIYDWFDVGRKDDPTLPCKPWEAEPTTLEEFIDRAVYQSKAGALKNVVAFPDGLELDSTCYQYFAKFAGKLGLNPIPEVPDGSSVASPRRPEGGPGNPYDGVFCLDWDTIQYRLFYGKGKTSFIPGMQQAWRSDPLKAHYHGYINAELNRQYPAYTALSVARELCDALNTSTLQIVGENAGHIPIKTHAQREASGIGKELINFLKDYIKHATESELSRLGKVFNAWDDEDDTIERSDKIDALEMYALHDSQSFMSQAMGMNTLSLMDSFNLLKKYGYTVSSHEFGGLGLHFS